MPKYGLIACFSQAIKAWQGKTLVNISSTVRFGKNLGVGKWKKKIWILAFQNVAKTGNIGKKSPVAGDIDYVRYLSMLKKVNIL